MPFISSYAKNGADVNSSNLGAAARGATQGIGKGNLIGFIVAGVVEVHDFIKSEDLEKNWGSVLGGLSVAFIKVWAAGFAGTLAAAAVLTFAAAPVVLVVGVGVAAAIVVGVGLDILDNWVGFSRAARKIGQALGQSVATALDATAAFVDRILVQPVDALLDQWMVDFRKHLRRNDPVGHCALFCSDPMDQLRAWRFGLGGRY